MEADKQQLLKNYLEAKIYIDERDGGLNYANDLRRKYPEYLGLVDFTKIYIKITKYRCKRYGTSRLGYSDWDITTIEEKQRYKNNKKNKQKRWRKKYGIYD